MRPPLRPRGRRSPAPSPDAKRVAATMAIAVLAVLARGVAGCTLDNGGGAGAAEDAGSSPSVDASLQPSSDADVAKADAFAPSLNDAAVLGDAQASPAVARPCPAAPLALAAWVHGNVAYDGRWNEIAITRRGGASLRPLADGGSAFVLGGGDDAVLVGAPGAVVDAKLSLSVETWLFANDTTGNVRIVDRSVPGRPDTGWGFDILAGGALRLFYGPLDSPFHFVQSPAGAVVAGRWQHVAGTVAGATSSGGSGKGTTLMKLYVNGVESGTLTFDDARPIPASMLALTLGGSPIANASPSLGLSGSLSEAATWTRALTAIEIAGIARGGPTARCGM